jgi:hypothetical protein
MTDSTGGDAEDLGVVVAWMKLVGSGDHAGACLYLAPDVRFVEPPTLPYGGVWEGHERFQELSRTVAATWEFDRSYPANVRTSARCGFVVLESTFRATSRRTGRSVDGRLAQCVTVQDGKITEVVPYYWDTATYAAACS